MIFAIDDPTAQVIIAGFGVVSGLLIEMLRRTRNEVRAVNRAVNNVPAGTPPLVQRVAAVERRVDIHSRWVTDALQRIGSELGVKLPAHTEYEGDQ